VGPKMQKKMIALPINAGIDGESKTITLIIEPYRKIGNNPSQIIVEVIALIKIINFFQRVEIFVIKSMSLIDLTKFLKPLHKILRI
jgi:hypothetical protein